MNPPCSFNNTRMTTLTLRHYPLTLSWIANRRDQQIERAIRRVRVRASRRRVKQVLRMAIARK